MQISTAQKAENVNSRISHGQAKSSFFNAEVRGQASRLNVNEEDQKSVRVKPSPFLSQTPLVPRPLEFCDRPHDREPGTDYK